MDYSKWDKVVDSEEDEEKHPSNVALRESLHREDREARRGLQEEIGDWLKRQMHILRKEENDPNNRTGNYRHHSSHMQDTPKINIPYRKVNNEERDVLAMLIAVSDFEEGETNLTRHPELLDLVRHHRWLEDDPGTLELLCRIHNAIMRRAGNPGVTESDEDRRMRDRVLCGINTLAAPKRAKSAGLLDLLTKICTPENEHTRELRRKWQTKEFAKDALFDSLFPDLRQYNDDEKADESMWEIWLLLVLIVVVIIGVAAFIYFAGPLSASGRNHTRTGRNHTRSNNSTMAASAAGGSAATTTTLTSTITEILTTITTTVGGDAVKTDL